MSIISMTGFAREEWGGQAGAWVWEVKSVNGKGFDLRSRLPAGMDRWESRIREMVVQHCRRGSVTLSLFRVREPQAEATALDPAALKRLAETYEQVSKIVPVAPPRLESLLSNTGLLAGSGDEPSAWEEGRLEACFKALASALDHWQRVRQQEGGKLRDILRDSLRQLVDLIQAAANHAAAQPAAIQKRFTKQLEEIIGRANGIDKDRLHQELALLATKADVREELDRLKAHISAAEDLLRQDRPVGRQFDFLCQEFNREANTLCSKSADLDLTQIGLRIKAVIDQIREQVQNIE